MSGIGSSGPAEIGLPPAQFAAAFPFHFALDPALRIVQAGRSLQRICPDVVTGAELRQLFRPVRPEGEWSLAWLRGSNHQLFLFKHLGTGTLLRGEFVILPGEERLVFLGSPWFTEATEIAEKGLRLDEFATHDSVVDLLQVMQAHRVALADAKRALARLSEQRAELRAANKLLEEQEAESRRLALIAARTDNAVVLTDPEFRISWVNNGFTRLTGYTLEEVIGRNPGRILQGAGTDPETVGRIRERLRRGQGFVEEILNYAKSGRPYWVKIEAQAIRDEAGRVVNFMAIEGDITELRAGQQRLRLQWDVSRILDHAEGITQAVPEVLRVVCQDLGWQVGCCWRPEGGRLRFLAAWHAADAPLRAFVQANRGFEFEPGVGLPGRVWQRGETAWIQDVVTDQNFPRRQAASREGLHSALGFPVFARGSFWGIMEFFSQRIEEPDSELSRTLTAVGQQIGQFIVRREAEDVLRETNLLQTAILGCAAYSMISTGTDGIIRTFNPAAERMLGYCKDEVVGRATLLLLHDRHEVESRAAELSREWGREIEPGFEVFVANAESGQSDEREWTYVRKDGGRVPVRLSVTPLVDDCGVLTGYLGLAVDITESKRSTEELRRAKEAADAASLAKSEFLASVSHELRTPLTVIRGFLQMMLDEPEMPAGSRCEFLSIVYQKSLRLSGLVDDLLEVSSIESGRRGGHDEPLDLRRILEECLLEIREPAQRKSLRILEPPPEPVPPVWGDRVQLHSICGNLLSNAVKFTPDGGWVRLGVAPVGDHVLLTVADSGPGIPPEHREKIFEKFYRIPDSRNSAAGTGLGLAIVKSLVDRCGGRIELENPEGAGACFRVYLPVARGESSQKLSSAEYS